eukprot:3712964-Prymnesium_polylepis.1
MAEARWMSGCAGALLTRTTRTTRVVVGMSMRLRWRRLASHARSNCRCEEAGGRRVGLSQPCERSRSS